MITDTKIITFSLQYSVGYYSFYGNIKQIFCVTRVIYIFFLYAPATLNGISEGCMLSSATIHQKLR